MDRRGRNIQKDFIKRKSFLKNEIKYIILKSILSNKNVKPIVRGFSIFKLNSLRRRNRISYQNSPCLMTGRIGGGSSYTQVSRHSFIKLATSGLTTNFRISSW